MTETSGEDKRTGKAFPYQVPVGIGLILLAILYRLPDRVITVFDWDNVQYLLALMDFDPVAHQPHPPGHPLYVFTGWLFSLLVNNGQLGYQVVNILFFALGAFWTYLLGRKLFGDLAGMIGAFIYLVSPLAGFFVAFPNTFGLEGAMTAGMWLLMADILDDRVDEKFRIRKLWMLPVVYAIFVGFRPSFLAFAIPGVLYVVLSRYPKMILKLIVIGVIVGLMWFIPMVIKTGGFSSYMTALDTEAEPFIRPFSIQNITINLNLIRDYAIGLLGWFFVIPVVYGFVAGIRGAATKLESAEDKYNRRIAILAALWVIPILAFHIFSYIHPGFTVYYLPLAALGIARAIEWIGGLIGRENRILKVIIGVILAGAIVVVNAYAWIGNGENAGYFNVQTLWQKQARVSEFIDEVRDKFPAEKTAVVSWEFFRRVGWYLPDYYSVYPQGAYASTHGTDPARSNIYTMYGRELEPHEWQYLRDGPIEPLVLPDEVVYIVVTPGSYARLSDQTGFIVVDMESGSQYMWRRFEPRIEITIDDDRWHAGSISTAGED